MSLLLLRKTSRAGARSYRLLSGGDPVRFSRGATLDFRFEQDAHKNSFKTRPSSKAIPRGWQVISRSPKVLFCGGGDLVVIPVADTVKA